MFLLFSYKSAGARRLGWLGHLHRMIEKARQIYLYEPRVEGKEEKENLEKDGKNCGSRQIAWKDVHRTGLNRQVWKAKRKPNTY